MAEKGKKEKHEEQVQFAAYKQFCDDTTVEKQRAIKEATAKMEQLVAAIQKAEADAATLAKEIAQLDEDISVYEGDKKAATEVNRRFFFLQGRVLLREKLPARGRQKFSAGMGLVPIFRQPRPPPSFSFGYGIGTTFSSQSRPTLPASVCDLPEEGPSTAAKTSRLVVGRSPVLMQYLCTSLIECSFEESFPTRGIKASPQGL